MEEIFISASGNNLQGDRKKGMIKTTFAVVYMYNLINNHHPHTYGSLWYGYTYLHACITNTDQIDGAWTWSTNKNEGSLVNTNI